jgi:flagellar basal-body rod protein FlgC
MNIGAVLSSSAIAMTGLRDATLRLDVAAHNVANVSTEGFRPLHVVSTEGTAGGVQSIITLGLLQEADLAADLLAAIVAEAAFAANTRILDQAQRVDRATIDLLA